MLLTYRKPAGEAGASGEHVVVLPGAPYVFDRGKLVENNFDEWL